METEEGLSAEPDRGGEEGGERRRKWRGVEQTERKRGETKRDR